MLIKVSARVQNANLLIELSKSFLLKKNSTKKYYFVAKLLDVEFCYTLIALITR